MEKRFIFLKSKARYVVSKNLFDASYDLQIRHEAAVDPLKKISMLFDGGNRRN